MNVYLSTLPLFYFFVILLLNSNYSLINSLEVADAAGSGGHPAPGLLLVLLLPPHPGPSLLHQGLQVHPTIHSSIGAGNSLQRRMRSSLSG
jgi:hypothetical protein